jgi:hypothetical protein
MAFGRIGDLAGNRFVLSSNDNTPLLFFPIIPLRQSLWWLDGNQRSQVAHAFDCYAASVSQVP